MLNRDDGPGEENTQENEAAGAPEEASSAASEEASAPAAEESNCLDEDPDPIVTNEERFAAIEAKLDKIVKALDYSVGIKI